MRSRFYRHLTDTALQDHTLWMTLINSKCIRMDSIYYLTIVSAAKRVMAPHHHSMLKRRLLDTPYILCLTWQCTHHSECAAEVFPYWCEIWHSRKKLVTCLLNTSAHTFSTI